jgi:ATP-dependent RNA helicase RhlE
VARVSSPAETVTHRVYHVDQSQKVSLLVHLLADSPADRALVFTRTKRGADTLTRHLVKAGVDAAAIHGNKSQAARNRALAEFRSARTPVLVATDLAARGIDVDDIGHVINYDLTADPETYIHRIGRTGRAGASGSAISFCTGAERKNLRDIERLIRTQLQDTELPSSIPQPKAQPSRPRTSATQDAGGTRQFRRNRPTTQKRTPQKPFRHRKGRRPDGSPRAVVTV